VAVLDDERQTGLERQRATVVEGGIVRVAKAVAIMELIVEKRV